jgi:HK97 family phage major capsid protein
MNGLRAVEDLSNHERKRYSLARLIETEAARVERAAVGRTSHEDIARRLQAARLGLSEREAPEPIIDDGAHCLELEVSQALSKELGVPEHGGVYVPTHLRSGLATTTDTAGGYAIGSDVLDIIDYLTAQTKVLTLGGQLLPGCKGVTNFPKETTAPTATWVAENPGSDVAQADPAFGVVTASPRMLSATTGYSRKLLSQSAPGIEAWLRRRLALIHATALDRAAVNGSGASNQPLGLLRTSGIGDSAIGSNGGAPTAAIVNALERIVADANADAPACGWLTTPTMREKLRTIARFTNSALPLWGDGQMLGHRAEVSANVPSTLTKGTSTDCHALLYGDWSNLLVAEFGVLEILVDPFTLKKQGMIEITSYQMCDIAVVRPPAFAACLDARSV